MALDPNQRDDLKLTDSEAGEGSPPATVVNPVDETIGMEARVMLKSIRLPEGDPLPVGLQRKIRETVKAHKDQYKLTFREIAQQIGHSESLLSEVLAGKYRADPSKILRRLNIWVDDDEKRRQRAKPIGFYPTSVFEAILGLSKYAKSNARIPDSHRKLAVTEDHPRIVIGYGPAGCGKSVGARAIHEEDPLSILIRIEQQQGTDTGLARLIIESAGWGGKYWKFGSIKIVIEKLRDSGRLLIIDEAHRLRKSGCELLRDLSDVCGIPILLLTTQEFYSRLTEVRTGGGNLIYDQFSRRVGLVIDLVRGLDGKGGSKRPIFSIDEVRAIFRTAKIRVTDDGIEYLCAVSCTAGIGMLGMAANIFEKAVRSALHNRKVVDERLLRYAAEKTLIPPGVALPGILDQIEQNLARNRQLLAKAM